MKQNLRKAETIFVNCTHSKNSYNSESVKLKGDCFVVKNQVHLNVLAVHLDTYNIDVYYLLDGSSFEHLERQFCCLILVGRIDPGRSSSVQRTGIRTINKPTKTTTKNVRRSYL